MSNVWGQLSGIRGHIPNHVEINPPANAVSPAPKPEKAELQQTTADESGETSNTNTDKDNDKYA